MEKNSDWIKNEASNWYSFFKESYIASLKSKEKLFYALTGLIVASWSLSIQFSPHLGNSFPFLLILSWIFYFISFCIGGFVILIFNDSLKFLSDLLLGFYSFTQSLLTKPHIPTKEETGNISSYADRLRKRMLTCSAFLFGSYLLAIILNMIFIIINYLSNIRITN